VFQLLGWETTKRPLNVEGRHIIPVEGQKVWYSPLWREFQFSELIEGMRHKGDPDFGAMCLRLREHHPTHNPTLTDDDWHLLQGLVVPADTLTRTYVRLYSRVAAMDASNARAYREVSMHRAAQVPVMIIAKDSCFGNDRLGVAVDTVHQAQCMATSQAAGIPTKLQLAVGMVVALTCNIDTEIRLVNGQRGEVLG